MKIEGLFAELKVNTLLILIILISLFTLRCKMCTRIFLKVNKLIEMMKIKGFLKILELVDLKKTSYFPGSGKHFGKYLFSNRQSAL